MSEVSIRPIKKIEIEVINTMFKGQWKNKHLQRLEKQERGDAVYLFAWIKDLPAGHLFLKWKGSADEFVHSKTKEEIPDIEDLFVLDEYRKKGIGSLLLDFADSLARDKGFRKTGLSVSVDDSMVKNMYLKRGFVDAGFGNYEESYSFTEEDGKTYSWKEICIYLIKELY
jgi:GNAT superfamily N-acetyltransferase